MSTRYFTTTGTNGANGANGANAINGTDRSEARFDALYMAARRQHTEALRQAEMARLAHSVERCRHGGASRQGRTAAAVRRVAGLITRKGRPTAASAS